MQFKASLHTHTPKSIHTELICSSASQVQKAVQQEVRLLWPSSRSSSTTPLPHPIRPPITAQTSTPSTRVSLRLRRLNSCTVSFVNKGTPLGLCDSIFHMDLVHVNLMVSFMRFFFYCFKRRPFENNPALTFLAWPIYTKSRYEVTTILHMRREFETVVLSRVLLIHWLSLKYYCLPTYATVEL